MSTDNHSHSKSRDRVATMRSQGRPRYSARGPDSRGALAFMAVLFLFAASGVLVNLILGQVGDLSGGPQRLLVFVAIGALPLAIGLLLFSTKVKHRLERDHYRYYYDLQYFDMHLRQSRYRHDPRNNAKELAEVFGGEIEVAKSALTAQILMREKILEDVLGWAHAGKDLDKWLSIAVLLSLLFAARSESMFNAACAVAFTALIVMALLHHGGWFRRHFIAAWEMRAKVYEDLDPMSLLKDYVGTQQSLDQISDRLFYLGYNAMRATPHAQNVIQFFRNGIRKSGNDKS